MVVKNTDWKLLDTATINQFLWRHDLMRTGCNLMDEMENEYWAIADGIQQRLQIGEDLGAAVSAEFDEAFWPDCLHEGKRQERFTELLADMQGHLLLQKG